MDVRQFALRSPARVVAGAFITIVAFAIAYPFVGGIQETVQQTGVTITYTAEWGDFSRPRYLIAVLTKSFHFSVQTFTLAGSTSLETTTARTLADAEALLGMGFLGLFTASLCRTE